MRVPYSFVGADLRVKFAREQGRRTFGRHWPSGKKTDQSAKTIAISGDMAYDMRAVVVEEKERGGEEEEEEDKEEEEEENKEERVSMDICTRDHSFESWLVDFHLHHSVHVAIHLHFVLPLPRALALLTPPFAHPPRITITTAQHTLLGKSSSTHRDGRRRRGLVLAARP